MKVRVITRTKDTQSGLIRAYIVQNAEVRVKSSTAVRKRLERRRKARRAGLIARNIIKGLYSLSVIFSLMLAASLINKGITSPTETAQLIASMIWTVSPAAAIGLGIMKGE